MRWKLYTVAMALACVWVWGATPATRPATTAPSDPALDWLLGQATTAPAAGGSAAATQPVSPLAAPPRRDEAREGAIYLSDGQRLSGKISTTPGKPVRIFDGKEYSDIPFALIRSLEAKILWEREQEEWHFIESGSDLKEFTGKTYPARELHYTAKLLNGQSITGGVVAPLYLQTPDGKQTLVLHKRQKGEVGQSLSQLLYVSRVELSD